MEKTQAIIRTFGKADSYGIGEEVVPGVALFKKGNYDLTREELDKRLGRK